MVLNDGDMQILVASVNIMLNIQDAAPINVSWYDGCGSIQFVQTDRKIGVNARPFPSFSFHRSFWSPEVYDHPNIMSRSQSPSLACL